MQESTLAALHQDLESKHQARGGSGGLGFNAADAKASKKAEKKGNKRVRGADDGRRDFSSTSSGAVAAGHWDPWARPVEFKMRTKNTTVGGLYSMFVRGDTMGGTLKDAQAATPASGAEGDSHGKQKRAKAARQDKTKKRRPRENGGGADNASAACVKSDKASKGEAGGQGPTDRAAAVAAQAGNGAPASFDWEADILRRLHESPSGKVNGKLLRKSVLKAARAALGPADGAGLKKLYKKTIRRAGGLCEADDPETGVGVVQLRR